MVTAELLRVAGALAAVSGLYYAIAVFTDQTYRDEFLSELTGETTRWFDLKRTGRLVSRVQQWNPGGKANIKPEHNLRPIPNAEILNSTGTMKQNPGY